MNLTELCFLSDDADENDGLGDAGIETYKDAIYASIARETGQNSADAWEAKPVKMSFDVIEVDRSDFPSLPKFTSTVEICLNQALKEKDEKAIDFFKRAKSVLAASTIKVLRVADYNTKGLVGPCERGTSFHSLVKGSGISIKDSDTSGGSFGIGKNAAFAISELQTVFYSSQYKQTDGKLAFISQGKTILVSHIDEDGKRRKAKGYWGLPNFKAITSINDVPKWLRREEQGTSIFSAGFRYQKGWQFKMAASLLSNFFYAIYKGEMEFHINDGEIKIDKQTLGELFDKCEIVNAAEENNSLEGFLFAKSLYECVMSPYAKEKIFNQRGLGDISFRILVKENLPRKLALIRNGMVITDNLEYFGDKFARFPMAKEFVAIIEAQEHRGNALIKKLENPRHDGLSAERINDPEKRKEAYDYIKDLIKNIRNAIREETTNLPDEEVVVDELTEFFADDSSREKSNEPENEDDLETFVYAITERKQTRPTAKSSLIQKGAKTSGGQRDRDSEANNVEGSSAGVKPGQNEGSNEDSAQTDGRENMKGGQNEKYEITITDIRNLIINDDGKIYRRIFFTSPVTCLAHLSIQVTGINNVEEIKLVSARSAEIRNNQAVVEVTKDDRVVLDVEIAENYNGPIEISAYTTEVLDENK